MQIVTMDTLVPKDHILRLVDEAIDFSFIYDLVGFFRKYDYTFDEYFDCYICPQNQDLKDSTTNREGYREYKSNPKICQSCPERNKCTQSKNYTKVVTRHVWADYLDQCEEIRLTIGRKEEYQLRKETIERVFGTAKEHHGMRYTQYVGKVRVAM